MVKIGITGGIGSGKSYVSRLLMERSVPVYDTDSEAKRLMLENAEIRKGLIKLLGNDVYQENGELNKPLVAGYLFADKQNAERINSVVHPQVKADFNRWAMKQDKRWVALESAILFESGFEDVVDFVVAVYAPVEIRLKRVQERDGVTESQVRKRMAAQLDDETKCNRSDFVIINDGSKSLEVQVDNLLQTLEMIEKGNG